MSDLCFWYLNLKQKSKIKHYLTYLNIRVAELRDLILCLASETAQPGNLQVLTLGSLVARRFLYKSFTEERRGPLPKTRC